MNPTKEQIDAALTMADAWLTGGFRPTVGISKEFVLLAAALRATEAREKKLRKQLFRLFVASRLRSEDEWNSPGCGQPTPWEEAETALSEMEDT